jgi:Sigma-70, region 4
MTPDETTCFSETLASTSETVGVQQCMIADLKELLSPAQFSTISLYFFEGYSLEAIADRLAQTLSDIRSHYYRGLEKLRNRDFPKHLPVVLGGTVERDKDQGVPVSVSGHPDDYFVELCALSTADVLTIEERRRLELHMSVCTICPTMRGQYGEAIAMMNAVHKRADENGTMNTGR